ncbi:hypothetical protein V6N11_062132 [Hibiscus sabdariffa]|uniref:Uncharacterized protein n=1 Tax=Hibiscus sabdariffa TaxID=183260 RepID=A0ABR2PRR2_9ROSI
MVEENAENGMIGTARGLVVAAGLETQEGRNLKNHRWGVKPLVVQYQQVRNLPQDCRLGRACMSVPNMRRAWIATCLALSRTWESPVAKLVAEVWMVRPRLMIGYDIRCGLGAAGDVDDRRGSETATPGSIDGRRTQGRRGWVSGTISRGHHRVGVRMEQGVLGYSSRGARWISVGNVVDLKKSSKIQIEKKKRVSVCRVGMEEEEFGKKRER